MVQFHCVAVTPNLLCAGTALGDLWVLETISGPARFPAASTTRPLRLFYSYSHADEALRDELDAHLAILKRQGILETWHDRHIEAGTEGADTIERSLEEADIILLALAMTLEMLAEESGVSPTYLSAIERGDRRRGLSLDVALRIAKGMNTDLPDLLGGYMGLSPEGIEAARLIVLLPRRSKLPILELVRSLAGVRTRRPT